MTGTIGKTKDTAPRTIAQHRARLNRFVVDGEAMAFVDEGPRDGVPVVLLHGMPTSSWLYRDVIPRLSAEGLRVIAPDMIGFGASDKPKDPSRYAFALQAGRLHALMQSLGIGRWTQVVHDLGGPWTWELAERNPEALDGLIVMNTTAYREGFAPPAVMKMVAGPMGGLIAFLMANPLTGPGQIKAFFRQFMARPERISSAMIHGYWLSMNEGTVRPFLAFARLFPWWFAQFGRYQKTIRGLDIRAATIWGKRDAVLDADQLPAQFARDLKIPPQYRHVLDAGHFLQEDQPDEVARLIYAFIQRE